MKLSAFTNEPGRHERFETHVVHSRGQFFGRPPFDNASYHRVLVERSEKPWPQPGDRKKAMNYSRFVGKVLEDTPYAVRRFDYHEEPDGTRTYNWDYTSENLISLEHGPFNYIPFGSEAENNAVNRANVKALNDLVKFKSHLGNDLGELHQTFKMFSQTASTIAKALIAARRQHWNELPAILGMSRRDVLTGKAPANRWLEFIYGWLPLFGTIHDLSESIQTTVVKGMVFKGVGTSDWDENFSFPYGTNLWNVTVKGKVRTTYLVSVAVPGLVTGSKYGLINPLSVAWELMPFSFVLDWFMPVGQTLEALTAPLGLQVLGGWTSSHRRYDLYAHRRMGLQDNIYYQKDVSPGAYREAGYSFSRRAFTHFQVPKFFANPSPFTLTRAASALALVRQLHKM